MTLEPRPDEEYQQAADDTVGHKIDGAYEASADEADDYGFDGTLRSGFQEPVYIFELSSGERIIGYAIGKDKTAEPFKVLDLTLVQDKIPNRCTMCGEVEGDCEHNPEYHMPARWGVKDTRYGEGYGSFFTKTEAEDEARRLNATVDVKPER